MQQRPSGAEQPDELSVFLLNTVDRQTLVQSNDPTGSNSLFSIQINGINSGSLWIYDVEKYSIITSIQPIVASIPEPFISYMLIIGLLIIFPPLAREAKLISLDNSIFYRISLRFNKKIPREIYAALAIFFISTFHYSHAMENIGESVSFNKSGLILNRVNNTFDGFINLTNVSNKNIISPTTLKIWNITAPGVALANANKIDDDGSFLLKANFANGILRPGERASIPVKFINSMMRPFSYSVNIFGSAITTNDAAYVIVNVHKFSGSDTHPVGDTAGSGVRIFSNGEFRAITNSNGVATFYATPGEENILACRNDLGCGNSVATLRKGINDSIIITMDEDRENFEPSKLRVDQVKQGLLAGNFPSFSMRFLNNSEQAVNIKAIKSIEVYSEDNNEYINVLDIFRLEQDGTIRSKNLTRLHEIFDGKVSRFTIQVVAIGENDSAYFEDSTFVIAKNKISGLLLRDLNNQDLNISGAHIIAKMRDSEIIVSTISNPDGSFVLPDLPDGRLEIYAEIDRHGTLVKGGRILDIKSDSYIKIRIPSEYNFPEVMANNNVEQSNGGGKIKQGEIDTGEAMDGNSSNARKIGEFPHYSYYSLGTWIPWKCTDTYVKPPEKILRIDLSACDYSTYSRNIDQVVNSTLTIRKGATRVSLVYNVRADIDFILRRQIDSSHCYKSIVFFSHIDCGVNNLSVGGLWGISLSTKDTILFSIERNFASAFTTDPIILTEDGDTGPINNEFDVSQLAGNEDLTLYLKVHYRRIYDDSIFFPLDPSNRLAIELPLIDVALWDNSEPSIKSIKAVSDNWLTKNDATFYSIPKNGKINEFQRYFDLVIEKQEDVTVRGVKVEAIGENFNSLILDEDVGDNVKLIDGNVIRVIGTFKGKPSSIDSIPPPSSNHQYHFTVFADNENKRKFISKINSPDKNSLWRIPENISRFGVRENGGDDWCAKSTYDWISANHSLLTAVNDISGEHGKDMGHATHEKGTDIDMYHFYLFPGADSGSGTSNYNMLIARIKDIIKRKSTIAQERNIATSAASEISAWINSSRTGIDKLGELENVAQIGYILDGPNSTNFFGTAWGEYLLKTGKITMNGEEYDLGTGSWDNLKYKAWPQHHHHVHITLKFGKPSGS